MRILGNFWTLPLRILFGVLANKYQTLKFINDEVTKYVYYYFLINLFTIQLEILLNLLFSFIDYITKLYCFIISFSLASSALSYFLSKKTSTSLFSNDFWSFTQDGGEMALSLHTGLQHNGAPYENARVRIRKLWYLLNSKIL